MLTSKVREVYFKCNVNTIKAAKRLVQPFACLFIWTIHDDFVRGLLASLFPNHRPSGNLSDLFKGIRVSLVSFFIYAISLLRYWFPFLLIHFTII